MIRVLRELEPGAIALLVLSACSDAASSAGSSQPGPMLDVAGGGSGGNSASGAAAGLPGRPSREAGGQAAGGGSGGPGATQAGSTTAEAGMSGKAGAGGTGAPAAGGTGGNSTAGSDAGPTPNVRKGCESVLHDGHLYALCRDAKVAFPQARKDCEAMHMQLIRLDSAAESEWIYQTFYAKPTSAGGDSAQMWTGATDKAVEGEWRWLAGGDVFWRGKADGMPVGGLYTYWGRAHGVGVQDQPNDSHSAEGEDCMVIRGPDEKEQGHWTDIGCGSENSPPVPAARIGWYTCEAG